MKKQINAKALCLKMAECKEKKTVKESTQSDMGTLFCFAAENSIYRPWDHEKWRKDRLRNIRRAGLR